MGLLITRQYMSGKFTAHVAVHTGDGQWAPSQWGWTVSYLPGRDLGRSQAEAALHLAELVAQGKQANDWELTERLARMVDMTGAEVIALLTG